MVGIEQAIEVTASPSAKDGHVEPDSLCNPSDRSEREQLQVAGLKSRDLSLAHTGPAGEVALPPPTPMPECPHDAAELDVTHAPDCRGQILTTRLATDDRAIKALDAAR